MSELLVRLGLAVFGLDVTVTGAPVGRDTLAPAALGPYRILRLLGEGGMGLVYLAEQTEPIRREVALKVIKPGIDSASAGALRVRAPGARAA